MSSSRENSFSPVVPSPVIELSDPRLAARRVRVWLKRDDLIHPEIPGNKWRKMKYNVKAATEQGHSTLLTFGGAYSNHIRATAAAGYYFDFTTIGVVRGEEHLPLNPTLAYAVERGMRLTYLDRATYRRKTDSAVIADFRERFGDFYLLPEGGSNELAVLGCAELPGEIAEDFDVICCACGTGSTLAGLSAGLRPAQRAVGFSVLRGGEFLSGEVAELQRRTYGTAFDNWHIEYDFHCGGFAQKNKELTHFIDDFADRHQIVLDWVYVAKMMYGVFNLVERGKFQPGTRMVVVVTG